MKSKLRMRLEIKEISAEGSFEGLLSPYGNVDGGGDVVVQGAYAKTLKDQGPTRPMLWQHKTDMPIGELTLDDRIDGLWCKGQLLMSLPEAQKAYLLIKAKIVKGLSIGFESVKDSIDNGVRNLKEIRLYEGSIVTFPMNESAMITTVKSARQKKGDGDFNDEFMENQLQDAGYQMFSALRSALSNVIYSDLSSAEKITASEVVIQQFSDAYMAYIPSWLDCLAEMYGPMNTMSAGRRLELKERKAGAKTMSVDGVDLTADCFAYVGDPDKTETWKLPIKFPGDDAKTKSHVRNALARFSQTEGIPESERPAVLAKIHAAAKKLGIDEPDKAATAFGLKAGAMISAANKSLIQTAVDHVDAARDHTKAANEIMSALIADEAADTDTSKAKAAAQPEPVDHSAALKTVAELKALFKAA